MNVSGWLFDLFVDFVGIGWFGINRDMGCIGDVKMMKGNIDNVKQIVIIKKSCVEGGEYVSVGSI
jgi:hypothetical protein